jgi:hypothetical protein
LNYGSRIDFNTKANIIADIDTEFTRATSLHPKFNSRHEALAILEEEVHELRMEVYKNHSKSPEAKATQRKEAVQVAAMALRFIYDCCEEPNPMETW